MSKIAYDERDLMLILEQNKIVWQSGCKVVLELKDKELAGAKACIAAQEKETKDLHNKISESSILLAAKDLEIVKLKTEILRLTDSNKFLDALKEIT
jgi:hypothetical protein